MASREDNVSAYSRALVGHLNAEAARSKEPDCELVELMRWIVAGWKPPTDGQVDMIMNSLTGET